MMGKYIYIYIGEYSSNRNDQEGKDGGDLVNRMTIWQRQVTG